MSNNRFYLSLAKVGKIRVACFDFTLHMKTEEETQLDDSLGEMDSDSLTIKIRQGQVQKQLANTVWHEINHAINHVWGVADTSTEEQFASCNAFGWQTVWQDNPKLMAWFGSAFK